MYEDKHEDKIVKKSNQNLKPNSNDSTFYFLLSKFFFVILLSIFYFLFSITPAEAATFSLNSPYTEVSPGSSVEIFVLLSSDGESINAVEGSVKIPAGVNIADIKTGNSIISLWIDEPHLQNGIISWSGIIPGGFNGDGKLFSFIVSVSRAGVPIFSVSGGKVLLNDGVGSSAPLKTPSFAINVAGVGEKSPLPDIPADYEKPETFTPIVASEPEIFDGKYFLVFAAQDKLSGIDHYEIAEQKGARLFGYDNLRWVRADSPYILSDQKRQSNIYVKAVDRSGNERIAVISPAYSPYGYIVIIIFVILFILGIFARILRRVRHGSRS